MTPCPRQGINPWHLSCTVCVPFAQPIRTRHGPDPICLAQVMIKSGAQSPSGAELAIKTIAAPSRIPWGKKRTWVPESSFILRATVERSLRREELVRQVTAGVNERFDQTRNRDGKRRKPDDGVDSHHLEQNFSFRLIQKLNQGYLDEFRPAPMD